MTGNKVKRNLGRGLEILKEEVERFKKGEEVVIDLDRALEVVKRVYEGTGTFEHWMNLIKKKGKRGYVLHNCIGGVLTEILTGGYKLKFLITEDNGGNNVRFRIGKKIPEIKAATTKRGRAKTEKKAEVKKVSVQEAVMQRMQEIQALIEAEPEPVIEVTPE